MNIVGYIAWSYNWGKKSQPAAELMNCFCGMVDRRKAFSLISSRDHCQRSSPSRISDTGFELAQNLSSGLVEWSCAVVITTTPRRLIYSVFSVFFQCENSVFLQITIQVVTLIQSFTLLLITTNLWYNGKPS